MRILICGSRDWQDSEMITKFVISLPDNSVIIEGEARGADIFARNAADQCGFEVMKFPADWEKHGKSAGYIRNQQQLKEGKPDIVVGFSNDITQSRGTKDMLSIAIKAGVNTYLNPTDYLDIVFNTHKTLETDELENIHEQ